MLCISLVSHLSPCYCQACTLDNSFGKSCRWKAPWNKQEYFSANMPFVCLSTLARQCGLVYLNTVLGTLELWLWFHCSAVICTPSKSLSFAVSIFWYSNCSNSYRFQFTEMLPKISKAAEHPSLLLTSKVSNGLRRRVREIQKNRIFKVILYFKSTTYKKWQA